MELDVVRKGCDFFKTANPNSDVGNYRLFTIQEENNIPIWFELTGGHTEDVKRMNSIGRNTDNPLWVSALRTRNIKQKIHNGKECKECFCCISCHENFDSTNYEYTKKSILQFVSDITGRKYDKWVEVKKIEDLNGYKRYKENEEFLQNLAKKTWDEAKPNNTTK